MQKKKMVVLSLGGSAIVPDEIDIKFLKNFRELIISYLYKYKFIIITGGGRVARKYQNAAKQICTARDEDLDWIGIRATWLNATLLKAIFEESAYKEVINNPNKKVNFENILIACGWKPGFSTDYDSVILAKNYNTKTIINMTDIEYLYDKDPKKYKDAKKIEKTEWVCFREFVGNKWIPGMKTPFDPIAAKEAQRLMLKLILIGKDLNNFKDFLDGKKFKGSIIE